MNVDASKFMDELLGDELSIGEAIHTIRVTEYDDLKQSEFADKIGVSRSYLCDLEHNRKSISIAKAIDIANKLGQSKRFFVTLAVQDSLRRNSLNYRVNLA
ncbi:MULTISPECIES: helix-turn-helix domain-containing protein [Cysteiniphilum]|uniref:helix-turn-helix domain-containing protein n=1 Tax=Cysteiniphilum TaxID=2056696 RepID=UPI001781A421|nr:MULTISPECIES: helix-turn-helix transcriptional regulator [Cysteiniphilum]